MNPHNAFASIILATSIGLGTGLAGHVAAAQSTPGAATDVVTLRDGTVLRGQVTESRPGQAVTIVLLTGEARTIAWAALAAPPASAPRSERDEYLTPAPDRVPVDLESTGDPVTIGVQTSGGSYFGSGWVGGYRSFVSGQTETHSVLCRTPCRLYVRPGYLPVWTGGGGNHQAITEVSVPSTGLSLEARASSHALWWLGIFSGTLGGVGLLTGGLLFVFPDHEDSTTRCYEVESCRNVAIGVTAGGAALLVAGIWLAVANGGGVVPRRAPLTAAVTPTSGGAMFTASARF